MEKTLTSLEADIQAVNSIAIVPSILDVVCSTTGMGFAAVARVTEEKWIACTVRDDIRFGLKPGGELKLETTICNEIRQHHQPVVIDHVEKDEQFCKHHTPAMYGFQSYISIPIIKKDGSFFGTLCAIDPRPAKVNNPQVINMFRLFADLISFHLHAIEQLASAETDLSEERRTAELREEFIAVLGHDLRNPLGAVSTSAELLLEAPLEDDTIQLVKIIRRSCVRMSGLIENVLDFARGRLGSGITLNPVIDKHPENILNQVINEMRIIRPDRALEIQFNLEEPVTYDSKRISQLFSNLLSNALTYSTNEKPVYVNATSRQGVFELSIANAGHKIPDDQMKLLFKPFSRGGSKVNKQGLGLGLYIANQIAAAHKGTISAESTDEETRFTFRMPLNNSL